MAYDPNFKRNKLAEQILCSLVANPAIINMDGQNFTWKPSDLVGHAVDIANSFYEITKPVQEEGSASVEVDEFEEIEDLPVVDAE